MRSYIFWGTTKSEFSHLQTLNPDDDNYVVCADRSESIIGGKITDWGDRIAYPVVQAEEYVDACLDRAGCGRLRT